MKLSKVLMTVAAAAALVGFAGCKGDDDDPNGMIKGSNKTYTIDFTNDTDTTSRGISRTWYNHAGAAVKVNFENPSSSKSDSNGVMGFIFDLTEKDKLKSFDVIGVRAIDQTSGKLDFYVSRYTDVMDLQEPNFGAKTSEYEGNGTTKEKEIVKAFVGSADGIKEDDGSTTVYIYAIQKKAKDSDENYSYVVYLLKDEITGLNADGTPKTKDGLLDLSSVTPAAVIPTEYSAAKAVQQAKLSVYANVYKGKTVTGSWNYMGDYKEVNLEED